MVSRRAAQRLRRAHRTVRRHGPPAPASRQATAMVSRRAARRHGGPPAPACRQAPGAIERRSGIRGGVVRTVALRPPPL